MIQICGLPAAPFPSSDGLALGRVLRKAMSLPSGDHLGAKQLSAPRVSSRSYLPFRLDRTRLLMRAPLSLSCTVFTQTTCLQSGAIRKSLAPSLRTTSSTVHGALSIGSF